MNFNRNVHCRRSIRLRNYDYSAAGAYFVTICTYDRECLFGEVVDGVMRLNQSGEIVREEWTRTPMLRPNVELDEFVIMPNHFHAIFCIHDVGAHCTRPDRMRPGGAHANENRAHIGAEKDRAHIGAPLRRQPDSIGSIIAGFKSAATKRINILRDNPGGAVWQRNYHERVIRDDRELDNTRQYIADNPAKWDDDENNPTNTE